MEGSQTHREAAVHASQSGEARIGGKARGLEMEQLCSLCDGGGRDGRDRIAMDGAEARADGCRARGQSPPSRKKRGKGGATWSGMLSGKDGTAPKRRISLRMDTEGSTGSSPKVRVTRRESTGY